VHVRSAPIAHPIREVEDAHGAPVSSDR
jgi:hypothetical protein